MVIYANKVIQIKLLPTNHILFIFKHAFSPHIFIRPFGIIIQQFFFWEEPAYSFCYLLF